MSDFITHVSAFLRKEIVEIIRQPKLLMTLIVGPFAILLIFGAGNKLGARHMSIMFVADAGSQAEAYIVKFAPKVTGTLEIAGVRADKEAALRDLRAGKVDLVAVAPSDPYGTVRGNKQADFGLYHNEIDPVQAGYVTFLWDYFINEINRQLLEDVVTKAQGQTGEMQAIITDARGSARAMRAALQSGNAAAARAEYRKLAAPVNSSESSIAPTLNLLDGISASLDTDPARRDRSDTQVLRSGLADLRKDVATLDNIKDGQADYGAEITTLTRVEARLDEAEKLINTFKSIAPKIIVRPLVANARSVSTVNLDVMAYFAPSVIVLLMQHLLITIAALSLVRERMMGAIELFRASPLNSIEILLGKYLSYMILGGVLTTILTAALIFILRVPMAGSWWTYIGVVAALLFASLGWGTLISIVADNDTQAVQYSMLLLLGSVFFSGAFLALYNIQMPAQLVSWLLPATYAIQLLQGVMLRGQINEQWVLWGLLGMGVIFFVVNLLLLRRKMARE